MDNNETMNDFLTYLQRTNRLHLLQHVNADGTPNMKFKENKILFENYLLASIPKYECSICLEEKRQDACKLKCGHVFCVECFAGLVRTSNNCALCRREITSKVIKKNIDNDAIIDIVQAEMETSYEDRNNVNLIDYIFDMVSNPNIISEKYEIANTLVFEIYQSLHTVAHIAAREAPTS